MAQNTESGYSELPMFFTVKELTRIFGISRTIAYALVNTAGFPCGRIGSRIIINRDLFLKWVDSSFNNQYISFTDKRKGA